MSWKTPAKASMKSWYISIGVRPSKSGSLSQPRLRHSLLRTPMASV